MNTSFYIVYSQVLDCFLKVRKFETDEIEGIFNALDEKIQDPNFRISDLVAFISEKAIYNYKQLASRFGDIKIFDEAVYEGVTEVYPMLTAEVACRHYNISEGGEDEDTQIVKYNLKELNKIKKGIRKKLIGQDSAIEEVFTSIKLLNSGFESFASYFFIGNTGVGKTELARLTAEHYLKDKNKLIKINCGEYAQGHEYAKLIGSPPGYVGSNEKGLLTEKADESSQWVILFDEVEKANGKLHNLLLGFLDEGRITDSHGKDLDFSNSIIIFTSNVGIKEHVGVKKVGFGAAPSIYEDSKYEIMESFKKEFSPEFINRIDSVVFFNQLTKKDAEGITKLNLQRLPIKITKKLVSHIVDKAYSEEYGARNIKRYIKQNVTLKLADKILSGEEYKLFTPVFSNDEFTVKGIENDAT
jgi:ATP-dependent Clp protease ATP-binding subunit ClpC